jgi:hypothetical protein
MLQWQDAYPIIQAVRDPAEQTLVREQPQLWTRVRSLAGDDEHIGQLLDEYTAQRLDAVHGAYINLHDFLLAQIYSGLPDLLTVTLPSIDILELPEN